MGDQLHFAPEILRGCGVLVRAEWPHQRTLFRTLLGLALLHVQELVVPPPAGCLLACIGSLFLVRASPGGPAVTRGQAPQAETVKIR